MLWVLPVCLAARLTMPALAQMTTAKEQLLSMEHYIRKTFFKTASLMANSCQAIAILGAQPAEVSSLAREYGHHLGLAFQARPAWSCTHSLAQRLPPSSNCGAGRVCAAGFVALHKQLPRSSARWPLATELSKGACPAAGG